MIHLHSKSPEKSPPAILVSVLGALESSRKIERSTDQGNVLTTTGSVSNMTLVHPNAH